MHDRDKKEAKAAFKGIKIELTHFPGQRRRKLSRGLSDNSATDENFRDDQGRKCSVAQYFQKVYNLKLQRPDLPCIKCGTSAKPIYFPLEVGEILLLVLSSVALSTTPLTCLMALTLLIATT